MSTKKTSSISGFYKLPVKERMGKIADFANISVSDFDVGLDMKTADLMAENVVQTFSLPLGMAMNFIINNNEVIVPMATEESSVIAACSNGAKIARIHGGFKTECSDPVMIGQIQLLDVDDVKKAQDAVKENKEKLLSVANEQDAILVGFGGGARDIEFRVLESTLGKMVVLHLLVDVRDAMGANVVNTMCEALAPIVSELCGGRVRLKILSNLCDKRLVKSTAVFDAEKMGGEKIVDAFLESYTLASIDPYRAATHNKGIMNGIDAVVLATGNDTRAVEAGAHAFAARDGKYTSLTSYWKDEQGNLVGELEMPLALGMVGGAGNIHPTALLAKKILGVSTSQQLAEIVASVGLAQNFAAVFALSTVGIQKGHMSLHAKNIAVMAGALGEEIESLASRLVSDEKVKLDYAKELLEQMRK